MVYGECSMQYAVFRPGWHRIRHIKRDRIRFLFTTQNEITFKLQQINTKNPLKNTS